MANAIMRYFETGHLPAELRVVSEQFETLAFRMDGELLDSAEKSAGLRKLLEAKDCFVRASLPQ